MHCFDASYSCCAAAAATAVILNLTVWIAFILSYLQVSFSVGILNLFHYSSTCGGTA